MGVQAIYIISKPIRAEVNAMGLRGYFGKMSYVDWVFTQRFAGNHCGVFQDN